MTSQEIKYQPAPGCDAFTMLFPSALYVGSDHLLFRTRILFSEYYRRVFYADIQAITVEKTAAGAAWTAVFGLLGLAGVAVGLMTESYALLAGAVFLAVMLVNIVLGPTCRCHIQTAVKTQTLPSVTRMSRANTFMFAIQPIIAAAQGETSANQVRAESIQNLVEMSTISSASSRPSGKSARPYAGGVHMATCVTMIILAGLTAIGAFVVLPGFAAFVAVILIVGLILAIRAYSVQSGGAIPANLKRIPMCVVIYVCATFVAWMIVAIASADNNEMAALAAMPLFCIGMATVSAIIGVVGVTQLLAFRAAYKARAARIPPVVPSQKESA